MFLEHDDLPSPARAVCLLILMSITFPQLFVLLYDAALELLRVCGDRENPREDHTASPISYLSSATAQVDH